MTYYWALFGRLKWKSSENCLFSNQSHSHLHIVGKKYKRASFVQSEMGKKDYLQSIWQGNHKSIFLQRLLRINADWRGVRRKEICCFNARFREQKWKETYRKDWHIIDFWCLWFVWVLWSSCQRIWWPENATQWFLNHTQSCEIEP